MSILSLTSSFRAQSEIAKPATNSRKLEIINEAFGINSTSRVFPTSNETARSGEN